MKKQFFQTLKYLFLPALLILSSLISFSQNRGPVITDTVTFRVNMKYMIASSTFNPATDTIDITGSMNDWLGGNFLSQVGTTDVYQVRVELLQGVIYPYKFRIHKTGVILTEQVDTTTRMIRVPDTLLTVTNFYNNINPAAIPMTFNCDMFYQVKAGHFTPNTEFVDVAGNFNNNGANDVLFNVGNDSIFSLTMFMDTALIGEQLKFKFRFNGNWATSELQGDSSRTYTLTGSADSFTAWYNNIDPSVPSLPVAYNLGIQDTLYPSRTVIGRYSYEDYNLKPEGKTRYQWYLADSIGGPVTPIDTAYHISYTIDSLFIGKFLVFQVTPLTKDSIVGLPVRVYSNVMITHTGIEEKSNPLARIYPNPVSDILYIEPLTALLRVELVSITGEIVMTASAAEKKEIQLNVKGLKEGLYFLMVQGKNNQVYTFKVLIR